MIRKLLSIGIVVLIALCMCGCSYKENAEPDPLVIEEKDIKDTAQFKKAFYEELEGKDVSLTVYVDGTEDFNYKGRIEVIEDGLDGKELILFINSEGKSTESDWF